MANNDIKKESCFWTWKEVKEELKREGALTPEEWDEIDLKVQILER